MAEWEINLIYLIEASLIVCGFIFLWNLACAPLRIEREAHSETKRSQARKAVIISSEIGNLLRNKRKFALWEAAHLLAGSEIQRNKVVGPASSYMHSMKKKMARGLLPADIPKGLFSTLSFVKANPGLRSMFLSGEQLTRAIDEISDDTEITRAQLVKLAAEFETDIPGLTTAAPALQSPPSTAPKRLQ